jgi:hypothetical protein
MHRKKNSSIKTYFKLKTYIKSIHYILIKIVLIIIYNL